MTIAVDFDGTLVQDKYPQIGEAAPYALDCVKLLQDLGAKIILYSMRGDYLLEEAVRYCENHKFFPSGINTNPDQDAWHDQHGYPYTTHKVYADVYIDDHNIEIHKTDTGCVDWNPLYHFITWFRNRHPESPLSEKSWNFFWSQYREYLKIRYASRD